MPSKLQHDLTKFLSSRNKAAAEAAQLAALQILCGLDFKKLLNGSAKLKNAALQKISRLIERERLKGLNDHWSYDLNRHIALKQARDTLSMSLFKADQRINTLGSS